MLEFPARRDAQIMLFSKTKSMHQSRVVMWRLRCCNAVADRPVRTKCCTACARRRKLRQNQKSHNGTRPSHHPPFLGTTRRRCARTRRLLHQPHLHLHKDPQAQDPLLQLFQCKDLHQAPCLHAPTRKCLPCTNSYRPRNQLTPWYRSNRFRLHLPVEKP